MLGESHSLLTDFKEHKDTIFTLLKTDKHFSSLAEQYQELNTRIITTEEKGVTISDEEFSMLKMRRAQLKDQLYRTIMTQQ